MTNIKSLFRQELLPIIEASTMKTAPTQMSVLLHANELPWDLGLVELNRYPEFQPSKAINALAKKYNIHPEQLLITCGSDDGINNLMRLFCKPYHDEVLIFPPAFVMYSHFANLQAAKLVEIPLIKNQGFCLDLDAITAYQFEHLKLLFVCSPNNPTGNIIEIQQIETLCQCFPESIVVVDEAYIEFSHCQGCIHLLDQYKNLVVLKTFSKAYGLAAARLGVVVADSKIIQALKAIIPPYSLNKLSHDALALALTEDYQAKVDTAIKQIVSERERFSEILKQIDIVKSVWPSETNFLLVRFHNATAVYQTLLSCNIKVRDMQHEKSISDCLRISIGTEEENNQLINALNRLCEQSI